MTFRPDQTGLEARFAEAQAQLHPRRREMLRAILDRPEETYFLSSRELGKHFGVDAATVVRTIQALGYERFADFAADLRRHFVTRITPYTLMQAAAREKQPVADRLRRNVAKDIDNLQLLQAQLDTAQLMEVARLVHRARQILVVGVDLAYSLSYFLAYGLATAGFSAEAPLGSAGLLYHKVKGLGPKDLLIAISFGRCLRETVEAVRQARGQGVPTCAVTNSDTTPVARSCDGYLIAPITSAVFTGSYVAPMAVLNTIIAACAHLHPRRTLARLRENEKEYTTGARWSQKTQPDGRARPSNGRPTNSKSYRE
jgi:DNA-binding MurR/RpiR family transcriptional regulator